MSWPPTLHDAITAGDERLEDHAVFPAAAQGTTYSVTAPCCGRRTAADSVLDTRAVPGTVVRGADQPWLCDACWTRMVRRGGWRRSDLWGALGAPADVVEEHRIRERMAERIQAARDRGVGWIRDEIRTQARRDVTGN